MGLPSLIVLHLYVCINSDSEDSEETRRKTRRMTRRKKTCGLEPNDQGRVEGGGGGGG